MKATSYIPVDAVI